MTDMIPKIIGVLLAFALLVIAPLTIRAMTEDMAGQRLILNEASQFIDRVTDKGSVTARDMDDLYFAVNIHGGAFDAVVVRYIRVAVPISAGISDSVYIAKDVFDSTALTLYPGDVVQVRVHAVTKTNAQGLLRRLMRVYEPDLEFELAGTVR